MGRFFAILGVLLVLGLKAPAATPFTPGWDDGYRAFQDAAPEYVEVEIQDVKKRDLNTLWFASSNRDIYIQAKVVKVYRTEAGLRPGHLIPILYKRKVAAGLSIGDEPVPPPVGETVPAFLKYVGDGEFAPAARHHTFNSLATEQLATFEQERLKAAETEIAANVPVMEFMEGTTEVEVTDETSGENPPSADPSDPTAPLDPADAQPPVPLADDVVLLDSSPVIMEVEPTPPPTLAPADQPLEAPAAEPIPSAEIADVTPPDTPPPAPALVTRSPEPREDAPSLKGILTLSDQPDAPAATLVAPSPAVESLVPEPAPAAEPVAEDETVVMTATPVIEEVPVETATPDEAPLPSETGETEIVVAMDEPPPLVVETPSETPPADTDTATSSPSIIDFESQSLSGATAPDADTTAEPTPIPPPVVDLTGTEPIELSEPQTNVTRPDPGLEEPAVAENTPGVSRTEADQDPMRRYADIFLKVRSAERLISGEKYAEALPYLQEALENIRGLRQEYPDFQPFMVQYRQRTTERAIEEIGKKAAQAPTPNAPASDTPESDTPAPEQEGAGL